MDETVVRKLIADHFAVAGKDEPDAVAQPRRRVRPGAGPSRCPPSAVPRREALFRDAVARRRGRYIAVISKMVGHADYSTTVDVYSHLSTARSRVAAARIDSLLKRRQAPDEVAV
jgi:integrase